MEGIHIWRACTYGGHTHMEGIHTWRASYGERSQPRRCSRTQQCMHSPILQPPRHCSSHLLIRTAHHTLHAHAWMHTGAAKNGHSRRPTLSPTAHLIRVANYKAAVPTTPAPAPPYTHPHPQPHPHPAHLSPITDHPQPHIPARAGRRCEAYLGIGHLHRQPSSDSVAWRKLYRPRGAHSAQTPTHSMCLYDAHELSCRLCVCRRQGHSGLRKPAQRHLPLRSSVHPFLVHSEPTAAVSIARPQRRVLPGDGPRRGGV